MRRADITVPMLIIAMMILASQDAFGRARRAIVGRVGSGGSAGTGVWSDSPIAQLQKALGLCGYDDGSDTFNSCKQGAIDSYYAAGGKPLQ